MAKTYFSLEEEQLSLKYCDQALNYINDDYQAFQLKGDVYFAIEEFYDAREEYQRAIESLQAYIATGPSEKQGWFKDLLGEAQRSQEKAQRYVEGKFRRDYYGMLGTAPNATDDDISRGYKLQALIWHPDKHQHKGENARQRAERTMRLLNEAKEVLLEAPKRHLYDAGWNYMEINQLEREGQLPDWMEAEMKERREQFEKQMGGRMHPMMMMGGGGVDYTGTKYHALFGKGQPFGRGGPFESFPGRVTKRARDRHHPDDYAGVEEQPILGAIELDMGQNVRIPYAQRVAEEAERRRREAEEYEKHKYDRPDYGDESDDF